MVFVPKEQVRRIQIEFGSAAERPLIQGIAGLVLIGLGCVGLPMIIQDGIWGLRWGLGFVVFGGLGIWLSHETFKKTHYIRVIGRNDSDTRKLVFRGAFQEAEFSEFIKNATQFGYSFEKRPNLSYTEPRSD